MKWQIFFALDGNEFRSQFLLCEIKPGVAAAIILLESVE